MSLRRVLTNPELLCRLEALPAQPDLSAVARLRKIPGVNAAVTTAAIELSRARRAAAVKFGPAVADRWVGDWSGTQQASDGRVAAYKAQRFAERLPHAIGTTPTAKVLDLACGLGGDLMAFADAGLSVLGVDADPTRAWAARRHAQRPTITVDITDPRLTPYLTSAAAFHLDPARRSGDRRTLDLMAYLPPPPVWIQLLTGCPNGAIKLAPGVDRDELLEAMAADETVNDATLSQFDRTMEMEYISRDGRLVQAMAWFGALAGDQRGDHPGDHSSDGQSIPLRATRIDKDGATIRFAGAPRPLRIGPLKAFVLAPDPALERAGLLGTFAAAESYRGVHPELGILTTDDPRPSPWWRNSTSSTPA